MGIRVPEDCPYKVDILDDQIILIHEFISEEDRIQLYTFASSATEDDWRQTYLSSLVKRLGELQRGEHVDGIDVAAEIKNIESLIENVDQNEWADRTIMNPIPIGEDLAKKMSMFFDEEYFYRGFATIQRHYPGSSMKVHNDSGHNPDLVFASVLYLNDDYEGGELYFPTRNLRIKAPARSLAIFATGEEYIHGVDVVLPGATRYAIPSFVWKTERGW